MIETVDYYAQNIEKIWSSEHYDNYIHASWSWYDLPFADDNQKPDYSSRTDLTLPIKNKSILEVGAAMGQGG